MHFSEEEAGDTESGILKVLESWDLSRLGYGYETILRYYQKGIDLVSLNDLGF